MSHIEKLFICPESGTYHQPGDYWGISRRIHWAMAHCAYCGQEIWRPNRTAADITDRHLLAHSELYVIEEEPC